MTIHRKGPNALRFALASALAATLVAGCAGGPNLSARAGSQSTVEEFTKADAKALRKAEQAVLKAPQDAALRAELGHLYLRAGRFESAATAFNDAMGLGENNARTALGLILADIARGKNANAIAMLNDWRDSIPAGDLGLALALAGETGRGVAVLSDAPRVGEATPKLRQNLAYAYALDGRWAEARIMMIQDVPAENLDQRLAEWGATARPEFHQHRVAALIGAPVASDPGLPQQLALDVPPAVVRQATEVAATRPPEELPATVEQTAAVGADGMIQPTLSLAQDAPAPAPVALSAPLAYVPPEPPLAEGDAAPTERLASAFADISQPAPVTRPAPVFAPPPREFKASTAPLRPAADGNHSVQLGSFSSPQGARRAWGIFVARNPELKNYKMVITHAVVRGKNYWRVAAAGFDRGEARGMCSTVKTRGGGCFAYATGTLKTNVPGAPERGVSGPAFARRR
jgi:Flp pilus assembly protein TadD